MPARDEYNPWESGLKERQKEDAERLKQQEEQEREEDAARRAAEEAAHEAANPHLRAAREARAWAATVDDGKRSAAERAQLLKDRAGAYFKEGEHAAAVVLYTAVLSVAGATHQVYSNRSAAHAAGREYEEALADAEQCIRLAPEWGKGYARKGAALHGLNRWEDAVKAYEAGVAADESARSTCEAGIDDVKRRRARAGGTWRLVVDGAQQCATSTRGGEVSAPSLGFRGHGDRKVDHRGRKLLPVSDLPTGLCAGPADRVTVIDGDQVKSFSEFGSCVRVYNEKFAKSGATSLKRPSGVATDGVHMYVAEGEPINRVEKLDVRDERSIGCKKEAPDKSRGVADRRTGVELNEPSGLCLADTSRMGGGGADRTLYVCDSGNHRVLALDPNLIGERNAVRFTVGYKGSGDGELLSPRGVAVHGDHLAVADAGNFRVCLFSLRGTFRRAVGERPPRPVDRPAFFSRPPAHVALARGHLFVVEEGGSKVHVISPESGEPLGLLVPPWNVDRRGEGALHGLCVDTLNGMLYVLSTAPPCRVIGLPREADAGAGMGVPIGGARPLGADPAPGDLIAAEEEGF